jgi:hypothetical protein
MKTGDQVRIRTVATVPALTGDLIVGRAVCKGVTWILTEGLRLVSVPHDMHVSAAHTVHPMRPGDQPWGLACLADGTLWTLTSAREVARLDPEGLVTERVDLGLPRIALFGAGDRLLFQQLPIVPSAPLLASGLPRSPLEASSWPGLSARDASSRESLLTRNLVNCGIPFRQAIPCWFADETRIVVTDGLSHRTIEPPMLVAAAVDQETPIWDAALAAPHEVWLLLATVRTSESRKAGRRVMWWDNERKEQRVLDLAAPARLILGADQSGCLLLGVHGELVRVTKS